MKYKIIFIIFLSICFIKGFLFSNKYSSDDYTKEYTVFVESLEDYTQNKVSYNVKIMNTNDKFILNLYDNSYDNIQTDLSVFANYKYGDVLKVKGKISIPQKLNNPGEFNYKQFLYSNKIYGLINSYENPIKVPSKMNIIQNAYSKIYEFKAYVKDLIKVSFKDEKADLAIAMIYGDTNNLDETTKQSFETIGVSHLMSVSGTHVASFVLIINMFLGNNNKKRINKNKSKDGIKYTNRSKNKKDITKKGKKILISTIQILSICVYVIFTGASVSVLRAGLMIILAIIYNILDKDKGKYKALLISLAVIFLNNPFVIFNIGMLLSYLATLGIILYAKYFTNYLHKFIPKVKNKVVERLIKTVVQSIAITLSVQLMILPVQIQTFNKISFPVIISNLIIGTISIPIRVIGTIGIILSFIPTISSFVFTLLKPFVSILICCVNLFEQISFSISLSSMPFVFFVVYYLFTLCIYMFVRIDNIVKNNNKIKQFKYNLKKLKLYLKKIMCMSLILVVLLIAWVNIYNVYFSEYVYYFNVEQGDMSYIKSKTNSVIVDIGSMRQGLASNVISNFFKSNNLKSVDSIIISHFHTDHMNGLEELLIKYKVKEVIYTAPKKETKVYKNFKEVIKKYNITKTQVKAGDKIIRGNIHIEFLLPDNNYINSKDEENANSLICKIEVNNKTLLYMGDASKETEEKLLKSKQDLNDIYILKVGHHGSKTATTQEFIKKIKPSHAVISALKKYYGHPHEDTINTLESNQVNINITEKHGAIKFNLR